MEQLTGMELAALVRRVFRPGPADRTLALLVDLPRTEESDRPAWAARRALAAGWWQALREQQTALGLDAIDLLLYAAVGQNNADLPGRAWRHVAGPLPSTVAELPAGADEPFAELLASYRLALAPTEYSATAPLKVAARHHGLRAATMPGFSAAMVPALRLDYTEISRRVHLLCGLLDEADAAELEFRLRGSGERCHLLLDLRHRRSHASGGLLPEPGSAGNLPSGEAYIVPYEGERAGDPSRSAGRLPVQLGDEVVVYEIVGNRAVGVQDGGPTASAEALRLAAEPAYGNLAELGLGVLGGFGVQPCGELLLDEKLGLHIAFGRSEHFGGQVGPSDFSAPDAVVHIDRVYLPSVQPQVQVLRVDLTREGASPVALMRDDHYVVDFDGAQA